MHVVVTGAAGFIGSHTCEQLVARGHRVTGIDSFDGYLYPAAVKRATARELAALPASRFALHERDITDPAHVAATIDDGTDVVCHLAALAGVRPSLVEPLRYLRTNVEGTGVILERMRAVGVRRMVFASSSSVYGAKHGAVEAFREDDPCLTLASPYAATKRMNELQLSTYRDLYEIGVFALRFFTVYGPRQRPEMAIAKFTRAIAAGEPITLFGDGTSRRDYTFIDDIVAGVVAAVERVEPARYELINLGGTQTTSLAELVAMIEETVGRRAVIDRQPDQPGDVPLTFASIARARALLDFQPTTAPAAGIASYWAWLQRRPIA
ncbi:MAG: NAD-dependent epimerase/dehydratase family protein [Deltaproteobacteria bacterium]|nr:NAD-dependent epimerase/dehydratase family protein [Deltaproteobacteria bacterium]